MAFKSMASRNLIVPLLVCYMVTAANSPFANMVKKGDKAIEEATAATAYLPDDKAA